MYRSPAKEWQVSWFVLGTTVLNGTDTVVCKYCHAINVFIFLLMRFTLVSVSFKVIVPKTNQLTATLTGDLYVRTPLIETYAEDDATTRFM